MTTTQDKEFKGAAATTTTTNAINAIDTAVSIASATGWPTGAQPFTAVIDRGTSSEEKVLCSTRSGLGLTISQRGYDNTATSSHAAGAKIEHCIAATDFDALFNHATNAGIDDHTQYLHISSARTVTAANTYSGNNTFSGNNAHSGANTFSGLNIFSEKQAFNMKDASTYAVELKAAASATVGLLRALASDGTTKVAELLDSGSIKSKGTTSLFGSGSFGATGAYIELGDEGDAGSGYLSVKGTQTNINMVLRSKGSGYHYFVAGTGTVRGQLTDAGLLQTSGGGIFGTGAISGTGHRAGVGDFGDPNNVYLQAQSSSANCGIIIDAKGSTSVTVNTNGGTVQAQFSNPGGSSDTSLYVRNNGSLKLVGVGAADSGGTGTRVLRVAN